MAKWTENSGAGGHIDANVQLQIVRPLNEPIRREKNEEIDGCLPRVLLFKPVGHFQYYC